MELRLRLIHTTIGRLSLFFFGQSLCFFVFFFVFFFCFCFPQTHFEPRARSLKSPITLHLLSHPPSLRSEAITLTLHLRSKTLALLSISDLNLHLTLHLQSKTLASSSISDLNLHLTLQLSSLCLCSFSMARVLVQLSQSLTSSSIFLCLLSDSSVIRFSLFFFESSII